MRQLFIDTPGGPDGCASTVFLYLSSHSGLSVSFTDDAAVRLHLMGLNDVEPSSMPAPLTAAAPQVPCLFPLWQYGKSDAGFSSFTVK